MDLAYNNTFNCIVSLIKEKYEGPAKVPYISYSAIMEPMYDQFKEKAIQAFEKLEEEGKIHQGPGNKIYLKLGGNVLRTISRFPKLLPTQSTVV